MEDVNAFQARARFWLAANMPRVEDGPPLSGARDDASWAEARRLQRRLWDGGFAGICVPTEFGGLGLTPDHHRAFVEESLPYRMPMVLNVPTMTIIAPTLLEFGTVEQKRRCVPAILRGDSIWVQFLSEPTGGSDLAGALTRAERDGDCWILTGSKIWSSCAHVADYAVCLARTNWDVPKHRGLTMFILKVHQPAIQIEQIRRVDGSDEFCQEYFDGVTLDADSVLGEVDDGWAVASHLLLHERSAVGGGSIYTSGGPPRVEATRPEDGLLEFAVAVGRADDPLARQHIGEGRILSLVRHELGAWLTSAITAGDVPPAASAILKLFEATATVRASQLALEVAGGKAAAWDEGMAAGEVARASLSRQAACLRGGSNEIQRNIISERLLGLPREWSADATRPFRVVLHNPMPTSPPELPGTAQA